MSSQEFYKILVPVDGSDESMRAASMAMGIAKKYDAELIAIHVINLDQYIQALGFYRVSYPDFVKKRVEAARQEASEWLTKIQRNAEQEKVKAGTDIIDTPLSVVGAIVDYAEREHADLVVIGTRGRSGFKKLLLGSVALGVVTYAPCPVTVAK